MVRRIPELMDRGSAARTTKRPQEMWLSPHERARLPCQTGGAILDGSAPSKRGSDLMFGACDRRAETTPEPVPLPDIAPSSAPPHPPDQPRGPVDARRAPRRPHPSHPDHAPRTSHRSRHVPPRSPRRSQRSRARPAGSSLHVRATSPAKMTSDASERGATEPVVRSASSDESFRHA